MDDYEAEQRAAQEQRVAVERQKQLEADREEEIRVAALADAAASASVSGNKTPEEEPEAPHVPEDLQGVVDELETELQEARDSEVPEAIEAAYKKLKVAKRKLFSQPPAFYELAVDKADAELQGLRRQPVRDQDAITAASNLLKKTRQTRKFADQWALSFVVWPKVRNFHF